MKIHIAYTEDNAMPWEVCIIGHPCEYCGEDIYRNNGETAKCYNCGSEVTKMRSFEGFTSLLEFLGL